MPLMTMIDANSPTFRQQYPNGAIVRDRLGRQLCGVEACDPGTGEVISVVFIGGQPQRSHLFHPAPLTIEPRQWLHIGFDRSLPVLDDRTPEEICGYGDDGLCGH